MKKNNPITYANQGVQRQSSHRQKGSVLPMTLVILLIVTLQAVSSTSSTKVSLQIAGNQQRQFEAQMVAENAVNFFTASYPTTDMPTGSDWTALGANKVKHVPTGMTMEFNSTNICKGMLLPPEPVTINRYFFYLHIEIRVEVTDPISNARVVAFEGFKYRMSYWNSSRPSNISCGERGTRPLDLQRITNPYFTVDFDLPSDDTYEVMYSYLEME